MSRRRNSKSRSWIIPALIALAILVLGPFVGIVSQDIEALIEPFKAWSWAAALLVAALTVLGIWYEDRRKKQEKDTDRHKVVTEYKDQHRRYLDRIANDSQFLTLPPTDIESHDATTKADNRMRLTDVYIKLNTGAS